MKYILINNNNKVIKLKSTFNDIVSCLNSIIYDNITLLKEFDGDIEKFKLTLKHWKIHIVSKETEINYYVINEFYELIDSKENKICKLEISDTIHNLFIKTTEELLCVLPINEYNISTTEEGTSNSRYKLLSELNRLEKQKYKITKTIENKKNIEKQRVDNIIKQNLENEEQYRKNFLINRNIYFVIKKEIADKLRQEDEIPILFKKEWNIFTQMENENNLVNDCDNLTNIENELYTYRELDASRDIDLDF